MKYYRPEEQDNFLDRFDCIFYTFAFSLLHVVNAHYCRAPDSPSTGGFVLFLYYLLMSGLLVVSDGLLLLLMKLLG